MYPYKKTNGVFTLSLARGINMSTARINLKKDVIKNKLIHRLGREPMSENVRCVIPICVGYDGEMELDSHTKAIIEGVITGGYACTILLSPKDDLALRTWLDVNH